MIQSTSYHKSKFLSISELIDASEICPVCKTKSYRREIVVLQKNPNVVLLECSNCLGVSASKIPTKEALNIFYGSYYPENKSGKYTFGKINKLAKHISCLLLKNNFQLVDEIKILDYGGGDGSLAIELAKILTKNKKKLKVQIDLVDYNFVKPFKINNICFSSYKDLNETNSKYNIIIASAILEHIPLFYEVLKDISDKLAPFGFLYARTPFVAPFYKLKINFDFTFPAHIHDLGPAFWCQINKLFQNNWKLCVSRTSVVETLFSESFVRTILAFLLKSPSRLEEILKNNKIYKPLWSFVGGWEVLFQNIIIKKLNI